MILLRMSMIRLMMMSMTRMACVDSSSCSINNDVIAMIMMSLFFSPSFACVDNM